MTQLINKKQAPAKGSDSFSVTTPQPVIMQPMQVTQWQVTVQFPSKEDADDFIEDMNILNNPKVVASFHQAAKESEAKEAKPMEELFEKYGI